MREIRENKLTRDPRCELCTRGCRYNHNTMAAWKADQVASGKMEPHTCNTLLGKQRLRPGISVVTDVLLIRKLTDGLRNKKERTRQRRMASAD